jgi:hypothetical protein
MSPPLLPLRTPSTLKRPRPHPSPTSSPTNSRYYAPYPIPWKKREIAEHLEGMNITDDEEDNAKNKPQQYNPQQYNPQGYTNGYANPQLHSFTNAQPQGFANAQNRQHSPLRIVHQERDLMMAESSDTIMGNSNSNAGTSNENETKSMNYGNGNGNERMSIDFGNNGERNSFSSLPEPYNSVRKSKRIDQNNTTRADYHRSKCHSHSKFRSALERFYGPESETLYTI